MTRGQTSRHESIPARNVAAKGPVCGDPDPVAEGAVDSGMRKGQQVGLPDKEAWGEAQPAMSQKMRSEREEAPHTKGEVLGERRKTPGAEVSPRAWRYDEAAANDSAGPGLSGSTLQAEGHIAVRSSDRTQKYQGMKNKARDSKPKTCTSRNGRPPGRPH